MDPESGLAASAPFGKYWRRHLRPQAVKRDLMLWPPGIVIFFYFLTLFNLKF
jgi:hypothetical protein